MQGLSIVRWQNILFSLILTALCVVIGWYSHRYSASWDLTSQQRHSLNTTSTAVLSLFEEPINALVVMGPNQTQRDAVKSLFAKYQKHKTDISVEFLNPETNPKQVEDLDAHAGGEVILSYKNQEQRIRSLSERTLTNALQRLVRTSSRKVLFINGHRERDPAGTGNTDYAEIGSALSSTGFIFSTTSLVTQPTIPEDTDLLVIAAPRESYFPGEVASILNYLGNGGNLLWLREPGKHDTGLRALEIELGVSKLPGLIVEANTRLFNIDSPTFAIINEYSPNTVTADFSSITLYPEAAGLDILPMQDRTIRPLLQTSENSWTETGPIEGEVAFNENSEEIRGPITIGVTIDRDREIAKQRIAIIGDADFLANTWLGNGGNREFTERLFNWLASDDAMLDFQSTHSKDKKIEIGNSALISIAVLFLAVIPLFMFSLAFFAWHRQRKG